MPEFVHVNLGARSYVIHIDNDLLQRAGDLLFPILSGHQVAVITDEIVASLYLSKFQDSLKSVGISPLIVIVPAGESSKSYDQLILIINSLLNHGIDRDTTVIALGGGVIGDLAGFAAAVLLRGLPFIQIPTTLLALVDSAIGGKVGINSQQGKNLVGSFHQPRLVLSDVSTLDTLPLRHLRSGYAEVVKYGAIAYPRFFAWLERHGDKVISGDNEARVEAIRFSCISKAEIVSADEQESSQRALLNLGHTFGHALEAVTGFSDILLHGEAVAIGMTLAFDFSVQLNLCPEDDADRLRQHFESVGLSTNVSRLLETHKISVSSIIGHMTKDKKIRNGRIIFVLVRGLGKAFVSGSVDMSQVVDFLEEAVAN